ncbi:Glucooligosaccharide oxidase [Amanita thiersii Skay4041]|uniref:Glucooligosaccharide oxidase n=1 Tax=Amanita thiersii Skay4041 TaxID=703135 RepID=A0A2A9NZY2_9AGAR|nr:Glucooligosaccharide oxidase [Amanita thiersii Skay4041]
MVSSDVHAHITASGIPAVFPSDSTYDSAIKGYNLRFTCKPVAIAYPKDAHQVAQLVRIGAALNIKVVARSGGHSYIANGLGGRDGALVVDLKNFSRVSVSSENGVATVEMGCRIGDVALVLNEKGRGIPHGVCPYVGIGGHSSYGGFGFTSRMWGLTLDTIISMDVVLANGTITTLSNDLYPDLFWAMRGAAGSFGIITTIYVNTFPVPDSVTTFQYSWSLDVPSATKAISDFQRFVETDLPKEFDCEFNISKGDKAGHVTIQLLGGWYGLADEFDLTICPYLSSLPKPNDVELTVGSYIDSVIYFSKLGTLDVHSAPGVTDTHYVKSLMTPEDSPFSDLVIRTLMDYLGQEGFKSDMNWLVQLELYGGKNSAINAVPLEATAFSRRNTLWTIQFYAPTPSAKPPYPDSGLAFLDNMVNTILNHTPPNWDYGAYINYIDERLSNWEKLYHGSHYPKLREIKKKYDPENVFSFPLGIDDHSSTHAAQYNPGTSLYRMK